MNFRFFAALFFGAAALCGQTAAPPSGRIAGALVDAGGNPAPAGSSVTLQTSGPTANLPARTAITDAQGRFAFEHLPLGGYVLIYGGQTDAERNTTSVTLDGARPVFDAGRLALRDAPIQMQKFEVEARREAIYNSIDRKVYNVGKDITSATGSASDLLQNVPSVQVDVDGNVSLRGDTGVEILINGKPSKMMGRNRAAVLEQMAAGEIERVEVITNPSAKYKPDGTGGIINLVLKRERGFGTAGSTRVSVGNDERANANFSVSYNPGTYTLHGSLSLRQDDRERSGHEDRIRFDDTGRLLSSSAQISTEHSRPLSRVGQIGFDYNFAKDTKVGASVSYDDRKATSHSRQNNLVRDASGAVTRDYERIRTGPQKEHEVEAELTFEHAFANDRELTAEFSHGEGRERDEELNTNRSRLAGSPSSSDATAQRKHDTDTRLSLDYTHPLAAEAKLELGYELEREKSDSNFHASILDAATNAWLLEPETTNNFVHDSTVHAFYATYGRPIGQFGFLGGLRYEQARIKTNQMTTGLRHENDYGRLYPSLHLSYRLTEAHELQLSYSHRVNRPDGDDLNPFPEYDDPFNRRAGNPNLVPEDTHAIEGGWHYEHDGTTYLASLYMRHRYHGITNVTRYIDANTLLTTPENLATSGSAGLELGATRRFGEKFSLNYSANVYRNEINAANLGFDARRTAMAWDAKLNTNWDVTDRLVMQLTTGYTARRLTAQGERHPSAVTNLGLRYNLKDRRTSLVLTVSDVFNSMKDRTTIDTPILKGETVRKRSSQIFYLGVIYNFGRSAKKDREELQFDNAL